MDAVIFPILAEVTGTDAVHTLLLFLVIGIAVLAIYAVGKWAMGKLGAPPLVATGWDILFVLIGLIVLINFLLGLVGKPFIRW